MEAMRRGIYRHGMTTWSALDLPAAGTAAHTRSVDPSLALQIPLYKVQRPLFCTPPRRSLAFYGARMFYYVWDVPLFMAMGAVGGLMGAGMCHFNVKVTQLRHRCGTPV